MANGGFLMPSCWAVYTSFPMPPFGDPSLDGVLGISVEEQRDEAMEFNRGGAMPLLQLLELLVDRTLVDRVRGDEPADPVEPNHVAGVRNALRAYLEAGGHINLAGGHFAEPGEEPPDPNQ
jgi:hypothetical protein